MFFSTVASQYFVGCGSPTGHSINSVSSPRFAAPLIGAVRTRTRAKRERSLSFVPSRQVIVRQACFGRLSPNSLALSRSSNAPRSDNVRVLSNRAHGYPQRKEETAKILNDTATT